MNSGAPQEQPPVSLRSPPALHQSIPAVPDHELLKRIGGGSYGEVWLARNALAAYRAVKLVHRTNFDHDRPFEREFAGIQKFEPISRSHEGLVDLLQVGRSEAEGYFYYVMELADDSNAECGMESAESTLTRPSDTLSHPMGEGRGEGSPCSALLIPDSYAPHTLKLDLQRRGRLPLEECIRLGLSLSNALAYLHGQGLVHRDIKPSNIIFVGGVPKLADVGLVAGVDDARSYVGTEGFIPPEGPGTPQADLYSLGIVLYEMSTGKSHQDFPEPLPDLASQPDHARWLEFNAVIHKACRAEARERYHTAEGMHDELALLQRGESVKRKHAMERRWVMLKKFGLVAAALALLVSSPSLIKALKHEKNPNPEAVRLYKVARLHISQLTDESMAKAIEYLNQAIQIDRQFVPAYISLFEIYTWNPRGISDREAAQKIKEIAGKLLSFNPNLGEGRTALAMAKFDDGDWQGGEQEIQRAIKLKPDYSIAHGIYGFYCALEGRIAQSHRELEEAQRLDPDSRSQATVAGFPFLADRDYDGALAQFRKAIGLDKNFPMAHAWAGVALEAKGDYLAAIAEYEKFELGAGVDQAKVARDYAALRQAYNDRREEGYWLQALELALAKKTEKEQSLFANELWELPGIYAQLGEKEKALDLLEKDLAAGELTVWLRVKPCFEKLRDERRFKELLRTLGHKN